MKKDFSHLDKFRIKQAPFSTKDGDLFGGFFIKTLKTTLKIICAPSGDEWEHVSVSTPNRCPTWEEMCLVKNLFFEEDETVIQFHPKKSEYKNLHPYCLHLWKNGDYQKTPPRELV